MAQRVRLAIVIPTYKRAAIVAENLTMMADELRALDVAIYLSDDSPDNATESVARELAQVIPNIHYRRNAPALGHDANLISTLCWADADYIWLMGDAMRVNSGCLGRILTFLEDQDLLFVRGHSDDSRMIPQLQGDEAFALMRDVLWHQTLTGATIYNRRVCDWVREQGSAMVMKRNFPQLSVILGYASARPLTIGWYGEVSINSAKKESYWRAKAIGVFVDDWAALVNAFPAVVPAHLRRRVIRSHSQRTDLFNAHTLLSLRPSGEFSWQSLRRPHFLDAMHLPVWYIVGLLAWPSATVAATSGAKRCARWVLERIR